MKILLALAMFFFHKRIRLFHVMSFVKHSTLKKILNFLLNFIERVQHKPALKSKPYVLDIEMTNTCNYRCLFCSTGKGLGKNFGKMKPENIENLVKELGEYLYLASLHFRGEPLLNEDLPGIIELFHKNNIHTVMNSNISLMDEKKARMIIESNLDYLVAAIDGSTKETYEKYRVGGNFEKVLENLKRLIQLKKELKSSRPYIEWQFIVFNHNIHQINEVKILAREMGVDNVSIISGYIEDDSFAVDTGKYKSYKSRILPLNKRTDCKSLWAVLTFGWDGEVAACCWDESISSHFGNVFKTGFNDIWNNEKFQNSRRLIQWGPKKIRAETICDTCVKSINPLTPSIPDNKTNAKEDLL
jgi:MoaA/NifB/PqqE/SkfB family radical SAM enzyme